MSHTVTEFEVHGIRFPTSEQLDGSDAMNPDPDHSAAYVVIRAYGGAEGHGFCFTIGRGNDVTAAAIEALRPYVIGRPAPRTAADLAALLYLAAYDNRPAAGVTALTSATAPRSRYAPSPTTSPPLHPGPAAPTGSPGARGACG